MSKKKIQVFKYEGKNITFDFGDGHKMVNATEMAKAFNKLTGNFLRLKQTKEYVKALESRYSDVNNGNEYKALRVVRGGNRKDLQGTWMDEKLALKFAAWLSLDFELWVWDRIHELLTKGMIDKKQLEWTLQKIRDNANENWILANFKQLNNEDENE